MIIGIHQPQFFPWLGYFNKTLKSDVFVFLDDCQYKKNEWQNRNRIKTAQGPQWLTAPVKYHFPEKIIEVKVDNQSDWKKKHLNALHTNYSKSPHFKQVYDFFGKIYEKEWDSIADLNIETIKKALEYLNIEKKILRSSQMETSGSSTERLVGICKQLKADAYLSGAGGKNYLDESLFKAEGIKVEYQDFRHPVYPQCFGEFVPFMCILDLLFNCSPEESRKMLIIE